MCEKYYKPVTVQYYIADYVIWVPRLTLLDLWTWSQNRSCSYIGILLHSQTFQFWLTFSNNQSQNPEVLLMPLNLGLTFQEDINGSSRCSPCLNHLDSWASSYSFKYISHWFVPAVIPHSHSSKPITLRTEAYLIDLAPPFGR